MYIILILLQLIKAEEVFNLEIDKSYDFYGVVPPSWVSYPVHIFKLEIPQDKIDQDVSVILIQLNDTRAKPQLFIQNTYKELLNNQCDGNGDVQFCRVQYIEQKHQNLFYFTVLCKMSCHYQLKVMTEQLDFDQSNLLMIGKQHLLQQKFIKLNLTNLEYERLCIRILDSKYYQTFNVYLNDTTSIKELTFISNIYKQQLMLFFWKNQSHPKNEIVMLIDSVRYLHAQLIVYQKIHKINLYQKLFDNVIKDRINQYELIIQDFKENVLIFEVNVESNNILLHAQPCIEDKCNSDYRNFEWQYHFTKGNNQFFIPPYKMVFAKTYMIVISINQENTTLEYTFEAQASGNIREILLSRSTQYQGILLKNQMAYYLIESAYAVESEDANLIIDFPKGQGLITSKLCAKDSLEMEIVDDIFEYLQNTDSNNYYNCLVTEEQINLIPKNILQSFNQISLSFNRIENQENITKFWFETQSYNYLYVIAIYSQVDLLSFKIQFSPYKMQFYHFNERSIIYNELSEGKSSFYQSFISGQPDSEFICMISIYKGNYFTDYYNALMEPNFKKLNTQDFEIRQSIYQIPFNFQIKIYSNSFLKYSLIVILKQESNSQIQYIYLQLAVPFKTLDLNFYYNIQVTENAPLYINLKSLQGNFICYIVSRDEFVENLNFNESNVTLTSTQQTLIFENPKQFYFLYVKTISHGENESYQIMYYQSTSFIELFLANTFYAYLKDQQKSFFYYQSHYPAKIIYIIRTYLSEHDENNNLEIYISLKNKCPDKFNFQFQIDQNGNYVSIPNVEQDSLIYVGVYSKGSNQYTLIIQEKDSQIELKDNIIQTSPMFEQQYNYYFYYVVPKNFNDSIQIQASTQYNLIELSCNIIEFNVSHLKMENYPMEGNYDVKELFSATPSNKLLFINQTQLLKCKKFGCLLLINVYALGLFPHFNITISCKYNILRNLQLMTGYSNNSMSYYYFNVLKQVKVIQITVRAIQICYCEVYIQKFNFGDEFTYPTIEQYKYKLKEDTLEIEDENNMGQYMIGVMAQDCIFEVFLHYGGYQLHYIHNGQQIDSIIEDDIQLIYMNNHQEHFRILIQNMKNIILTVKSQDQIELVKQLNNNDLFNGVIQMNNNLCYSSIYTLTIHPLRFTALSILLTYNNIPLLISYGRIYYDHCLKTCEFNLQPGELNLFVYSKSIELIFLSKIQQIDKMNLSYSYHLIPIYEPCILRINSDSYYSINLNIKDNPIILQLGRIFVGRNSINNNKTLFNFTIVRIYQDYAIQVSSKSNVMIDVYDQNANKILPKSIIGINKSNQKLIYLFLQFQQHYQIILFCNEDYHIIIDAYNQNQIKYINFNIHYFEIIEEIQEYNIQSIKDEDMQYEKIDCLGKTSLKKNSLATSRETFFKIQVTERFQGFPFNVISLVPHLQYSHDQWYLRNSRFHSTQFSNESIILTIKTMKRKKTGNLNLQKLMQEYREQTFSYKIHFSDHEELMRSLGCEIDTEFLQNYTSNSIFYNQSIKEVKEKEELVQFTILRNNKQIYGQIVFQAYYENYNIPYTYFYDSFQIEDESEQQIMKMKEEQKNENYKIDYIFLVIGISLILGIVLICIWGCMRHQRKDKKELIEEQEEVKLKEQEQEQELCKIG